MPTILVCTDEEIEARHEMKNLCAKCNNKVGCLAWLSQQDGPYIWWQQIRRECMRKELSDGTRKPVRR